MPRRVFTSGRKFSTTTSAWAARRRRTATPSADFKSSVRLRLLRCRFWKSGPCRGPPIASPLSRCSGSSTLMTLAPQSASWRTAVGPARTRVRSRTVKRPSALEAFGAGMCSPRREPCCSSATRIVNRYLAAERPPRRQAGLSCELDHLRHVVLVGEMAPSEPPFDRAAVESQHDAIEHHHRRAGRNRQGLGDLWCGGAQGDTLLGLTEEDAVLLCQHDDPVGHRLLLRQTRE